MAGWGGIVSGTAPSLMYKGYQDAQTQELGQQRAGLVNQGLQSDIDQQKANEPLVKAERELKMEGLEEQKNYNAFMRDFLPVAKRAVATQNPQVVADMLSYEGYVPDGKKYKGGVKVDPRTGVKTFTLTDDAGNAQEFGSINEMLEIPMALANPKNFMGWIEESRKAKAKTAEWMRDRAWDVRKMGIERANKLEEMDIGHGYKLDEATHQGKVDVEKARLTPTQEEKDTMMYVESLGVDPVQANMIMHAARRGDDAAYQRAVLAAAGNIFQNSFDTESAQKKVDGLKAYADKLRQSSLWGGGAGGAAGEGGGGMEGTAGQAVPGDPQSVYDQIRAKYPNKSEAEIKKAAEAISQRLSQGGGGGGAAASGTPGSASPSKGGGLSLSGRTMQQLDEMELPSTGDAGAGTSPSQQAPFIPFRAPSVPGKGSPVTPTNQQEASLGSRFLSAISPNEAYAAETAPGATNGANGAPGSTSKRGLATRPTTAPPLARQGAGGARGLMMADYAPEAWAGMPLSERVKYVMEREGEMERQQKEDTFASLPVGERARIVMSGAPEGSTKAYGDTFQRRGIPVQQGQQPLSTGTEIGAVGTGPNASLPILSEQANRFLFRGNGEAVSGGAGGGNVAPLQDSMRPSGNTFQRQPMTTPLAPQSRGIQVWQPVQQQPTSQPLSQFPPSQQPTSPQQPQQRPITDKWGDQVIPGRGTPILWHELPVRDRTEDVQQVVSGERSLGKRKDDAIFQAYALANEDPALAAEVLALGMKVGRIPPIFMWPSDNTELPEYQRGGGNIGGGLAGGMRQ